MELIYVHLMRYYILNTQITSNHGDIILHTDIADSDITYTKTLTGNGKYDMKNSKILILGMFMCVVMVMLM